MLILRFVSKMQLQIHQNSVLSPTQFTTPAVGFESFDFHKF